MQLDRRTEFKFDTWALMLLLPVLAVPFVTTNPFHLSLTHQIIIGLVAALGVYTYGGATIPDYQTGAIVGTAQDAVGQMIALAKAPLDLVRGSGGEEKVLKNAKDACATEALEIATYTAIERLARSVGDEETAKLAASILADEEKMLERVLREIPKLAAAVVRADVEGDPSYDITTTGAADAVRAEEPTHVSSECSRLDLFMLRTQHRPRA